MPKVAAKKAKKTAKMAKTVAKKDVRPGDRHKPAFMVRVPIELREEFEAAQRRTGQKFTRIVVSAFNLWKMTPEGRGFSQPQK